MFESRLNGRSVEFGIVEENRRDDTAIMAEDDPTELFILRDGLVDGEIKVVAWSLVAFLTIGIETREKSLEYDQHASPRYPPPSKVRIRNGSVPSGGSSDVIVRVNRPESTASSPTVSDISASNKLFRTYVVNSGKELITSLCQGF